MASVRKMRLAVFQKQPRLNRWRHNSCQFPRQCPVVRWADNTGMNEFVGRLRDGTEICERGGMVRITGATTYIVGQPVEELALCPARYRSAGALRRRRGPLNGFAKTVEAAIHELAPRYEGMDPFQVETIYQRMTRDLYSDGGQIHMNAVAAIEIACWDIIGKATGRPIYDLLGGQYHERLPAYANGWYRGDRARRRCSPSRRGRSSPAATRR